MFRRKIFFSIVFLSAVLLSSVSSQGKETLAVLDFKTEAVSETEMNAIVEFLSAELFNTDKFIVIDVSQRQTILEEMEFSMSGCTDDSCALEIGKMLSAELIVTGNLSKVGSRYLMSVKMLQTETSRTMGTANGKFADLDELIDGLEAIAYDLAGEEAASVAEQPQENTSAPERIPEAEPEPKPEPEKVAETEKTEPAAGTTPAETARAAVEPERKAESGGSGISWLSAGLNTLGAVGYAGAGLFRSIAVSDMMLSRDAYDIYMSATENVEQLYYSDEMTSYDDYYEQYKAATIANFITSGVGGGASAAASLLNSNGYSTVGKIMASGGMALLATANVVSSMAANTVVDNETLYGNYLSATNSDVINELYAEYESSYGMYSTQRYISYALYGTGGALAIASSFMPVRNDGMKPGLLHKILAGTGYILFAGGNFSSSMAFKNRIDAEDTYADYISAESDSMAGDLWNLYEDQQSQYEMQTYISYGLWGAGAASVIASMFIPYQQADSNIADTGTVWSIQPASTGFGFEAHISMK